MNVDGILEVFNKLRVDYILIGGMNYLLSHEPVLTYDVDLWIEDSVENREKCEVALIELNAEWGTVASEWGPVENLKAGWLAQQCVYCLFSPLGAIDIFRAVDGLDAWAECRARAREGATSSGVRYTGLADADMLAAQMALPEALRRADRIHQLRKSLGVEEA